MARPHPTPQLRQKQEGRPFVAARCLHRHQLDTLRPAQIGQSANPCRIVAEALKETHGTHIGIQPILRNIHSTNHSVHGNLPCACGWNQATIRSYVTIAAIPGSSTVVTGGGKRATPPRLRLDGHPAEGTVTSFHRIRSMWIQGRRSKLIPAGLHFHDLRRTAATKFYLAGLSVRVIAEIIGCERDAVDEIIRRYVSRTAATEAVINQIGKAKARTESVKLPIRLFEGLSKTAAKP